MLPISVKLRLKRKISKVKQISASVSICKQSEANEMTDD